ncbi:baculoviral IAP repeat-containing protein 7-A isoform X2 [Orussus abietinus]|uniref:baculoviral IAP repeat-containing protein 7-A isoform X2 n=1 Tax=Orussus abietinus TaxID=222816 RepID=UPI0006267307|nr:baculoviral IAP repeat-containing protein 7-A isoform X2 [Orussus abietinus]
MNVEENRLRTFSDWPVNAAVDCARIAKAGFYYTGLAQEVQCFACGARISEWNYGDQAMARHRQVSQQPPRTSTSTTSRVVRSENPQIEYRTKEQRLRSFENWPISSIVPPERLAESGFYYLQEADMVECAFCRGLVMKWEPGDDPDREHRIHFPNCDFYMHQDVDEVMSTEKVELGNVRLLPGTSSDLKELGIQTHSAPRQPKHATYEGRLRTFEGWPENLRQTPEMLANAGFYYFGIGDRVRCFHCDGGLRDWEATDDAWTEHARWFPRCGYVSLVRGQEFIKHCVDTRPPLDPAILGGVSEDEGTDVTETPPPSIPAVTSPQPREVTDAELEDLLSTAPARAALEIGLHVGRIKMAFKRRMEETGIPYTNADQLIGDVLHVQFREDDSRLDNHTPDSPSSELTNLLAQIINLQSSNSSRRQRINRSRSNSISLDYRRNNDTENAPILNNDKPKVLEEKAAENKSPEKTSETVSLEEENRRLKEARLCKICMDREVAVVFLPCGHLATCVHCAPSLTHCPMCRQEIRATVRTFLA